MEGEPPSWEKAFTAVDPAHPCPNEQLREQLEAVWPMLVHGPFLWYGREFRPSWLENRRQWIDQLEDGELVAADAIYACANTAVARHLTRVDDAHVAVDTGGYPSLGEAVRADCLWSVVAGA